MTRESAKYPADYSGSRLEHNQLVIVHEYYKGRWLRECHLIVEPLPSCLDLRCGFARLHLKQVFEQANNDVILGTDHL